jgi:hypothetical protein
MDPHARCATKNNQITFSESAAIEAEPYRVRVGFPFGLLLWLGPLSAICIAL